MNGFVKSVVAFGFESHFRWLKCLGSHMALGPFHDAIMCSLGAPLGHFRLVDCVASGSEFGHFKMLEYVG
jgi:hypothetical protein